MAVNHIKGKGTDKIVPLHSRKAYSGRWGIAPLILNHDLAEAPLPLKKKSLPTE